MKELNFGCSNLHTAEINLFRKGHTEDNDTATYFLGNYKTCKEMKKKLYKFIINHHCSYCNEIHTFKPQNFAINFRQNK